jgi:hypothetical protein
MTLLRRIGHAILRAIERLGEMHIAPLEERDADGFHHDDPQDQP